MTEISNMDFPAVTLDAPVPMEDFGGAAPASPPARRADDRLKGRLPHADA